MIVELPYGEGRIRLEVPAERTAVVSPREVPAVVDPVGVLRAAIRQPVAGRPLAERLSWGQRVAIAICDATRPQPRPAVLSALLSELEGRVRLEDVTVLIATGTHAPGGPAEWAGLVGAEVAGQVELVGHDARADDQLAWVGVLGRNVPVWLNRRWLEADVRVTTGFVEPHFFAGFSGGPKLVAPGLAGLETVLVLHDAARIDAPTARSGSLDGNPIQADLRAIAATTGVDFAVDVVLDGRQRVVAAFAGDLFAMHAAACRFVDRLARRRLDAPVDVVVTSNAGYPLDRNLYQAVKGMATAAEIVRPGGVVLVAAECRDGIPEGSPYHHLLADHPTPDDLDAVVHSGPTRPDQWQAQVQARVGQRAEIGVKAAGVPPDVLAGLGVTPVDDLEAAVSEALGRAGKRARLAVLPAGPLTIPVLADSERFRSSGAGS